MKINCSTANKINLESILLNIGYKPQKTRYSEKWYISPFRNEKTPSFKIDLNKNLWYDFGEGTGGTVIDFIMKYNNCCIKNALDILTTNNYSFHKPIEKIYTPIKPKYSILKVTELTDNDLIKYLNSRKINIVFAKRFLFQIHYSFSQRKEYNGIGFMNDFGGFEIRNQSFKGCLGKKSITTINNNSDVISLFESWSDFLSYLTLKKQIPEENFIILNSTSLVKKASELITKYSKVKCFFDNDEAGNKAFNILQENNKNKITNYSNHYEKFNDLNEYLINKGNSEY